MIPITDAERTIWLRQAHASLGQLLVRAANEHLPPIRWSITPAREIHGQCGYGGDAGAEFDAWLAALGNPDSKRMTRREGSARMTAEWDSYDGCRVALTATIDDEPAGE